MMKIRTTIFVILLLAMLAIILHLRRRVAEQYDTIGALIGNLTYRAQDHRQLAEAWSQSDSSAIQTNVAWLVLGDVLLAEKATRLPLSQHHRWLLLTQAKQSHDALAASSLRTFPADVGKQALIDSVDWASPEAIEQSIRSHAANVKNQEEPQPQGGR